MNLCNQLIIYGYWLEGRNEQHYFLIVFWSWQGKSPQPQFMLTEKASSNALPVILLPPTYIFSQLLHISCVYTPYLLYPNGLSVNFSIVDQIREAYLLFQVKLIFI